MLLVQSNAHEFYWIAPYILVGIGVLVVYVGFRMYENWYANTKDKLLYRQLWIFKRLSKAQKDYLNENFKFYTKLTPKEKRRFEHRVAHFVHLKEFIGREDLVVTGEKKLLIAAVGCMLSFGRKHYDYRLIDYILLYPKAFYSSVNGGYHKGEFNPMQRTLVLSWEDFEHGYRISDDNLNLGIHEFMHALQLDAKQSNDIDALRFERTYQHILQQLTNATEKKN